jgi:hypothetical protein
VLIKNHVHEALVLLVYLVTSNYSMVILPSYSFKQVAPLPALAIFRTNLEVAYQI